MFTRSFLCQTSLSSGQPYHVKSLKGCNPQILFGPFLNTFTQMLVDIFEVEVGWFFFIVYLVLRFLFLCLEYIYIMLYNIICIT